MYATTDGLLKVYGIEYLKHFRQTLIWNTLWWIEALSEFINMAQKKTEQESEAVGKSRRGPSTKIKTISIILLVFLFAGCSAELEKSSVARNTTGIDTLVFQAFSKDKPNLFYAYVMNADRFALIGELKEELTKISKEEQNKFPLEVAQKSFLSIQSELKKYNFSWNDAILINTRIKVREGSETKQILFDTNNSSQRLDLYLFIQSKTHSATIKIDDTYIIDGVRYVAHGFRLQNFNATKN